MPTVRAIMGPVLASGFRLAGLAVDEVATANEAASLLDRVASLPETGVVLLQQDWFEALPESLRRVLERQATPIIVPVPAMAWAHEPSAGADYILDLLQRAIGYRVRLQ